MLGKMNVPCVDETVGAIGYDVQVKFFEEHPMSHFIYGKTFPHNLVFSIIFS